MNLIVVPFHDWRKILLEGSRTRDSHFIKEISKNPDVIQVIVNRPTTFLEILLKRKRNLIEGELLMSQGPFRLYQLKENLYLIDYVSMDVIGQTIKGYSWFIERYGNVNYLKFIERATKYINASGDFYLLNQNVFAYRVTELHGISCSMFDAWDNFLKFRVYRNIGSEIHKAYSTLATKCEKWITNSKDNIDYFKSKFGRTDINLITNGVDLDHFSTTKPNLETPADLQGIRRPIVGFGGKITHLIDTDLLNKTMELTPEASFVIVGQILDKTVYEQISKLPNFHYLGDKHYSIYPNYVMNFDICTVPYVVDEETKSGANSIKVYEYLAAGKKVIGTNANGLEDLTEYLSIVESAEDFSREIKNTGSTKKNFNPAKHSWAYKTKQLLQLFSDTI